MRLTIIAAMLAATATTATAQNRCSASHETMVERLSVKYGEARHVIGIDSEGAVVEMFASEETGTWTVLRTIPDGQTCLVAAGDAYERLQVEAPKPGDDT